GDGGRAVRRADGEGVRPARLLRRVGRDRALARPAARPGLGRDVSRRHAHRRRARRPAPPQAGPARADPHDSRRRLQGRRALTLRTRLFAAIALIVVLSIGVTYAVALALTRSAVE